jgi:hypothetical protein
MVFRACATPIAHGVGSYKIPAAKFAGALSVGAHPCGRWAVWPVDFREHSGHQTLQHIHGVHAQICRSVATF